MRTFYKPVDLRSRKEMTDFLSGHFRYTTMNSWNRATSYACNLRVDRLGLTFNIVLKLLDMLGTQEFFDIRQELLEGFNLAHNYRWQAAFNGRSGGYLVLYQGELKLSSYLSYCTNCGQRNCRSVQETGKKCGCCGKPTRIDYRSPPKQAISFPGRGTDMDEDFEEWSISELRERVKLVQALDSLADDLVSQAIRMVSEYGVVEEEYFVPQTRRVLVAKES